MFQKVDSLHRVILLILTTFVGGTFLPGDAIAEESVLVKKEASSSDKEKTEKPSVQEDTKAVTLSSAAAALAAAVKSKPKYPPSSVVLKNTKPKDGMIKMHVGDQKLYAEITSSILNQDLIILTTIARGIGQRPLLGGFSWGDDAVWQFRKVGERIHVVRRNVRFTAKKGSPEAKAVKLAYTDSVLFSLPIASKTPSGAMLVNLTPVFLSDLPQISMFLRGFSFSASRSTFSKVTGYPKNVEIQVAATYASSGTRDIETVADSRGVSIGIHYSISRVPTGNGYKPRLADDRIGYFLSAVKDYSKQGPDDRFVRYINRWNLQKADPSAALSPPKKPVIFWLEKTVPYKFRKPIREGILEWNKAFEKAGFVNAIEVRQQPDNATWEPGDINYNTFEWITSSAGFAMGPSRVNPINGEILDADIIFDADFLQYWKREYETFTPKGIEMLTGGPLTIEGYRKQLSKNPHLASHRHGLLCMCNLLHGKADQMALTDAVMSARTRSPKELEKLMMQGMKDTTMHEVGHTLGLRHNFVASTFYTLKEANDTKLTSKTGLTASIMDYTPVNIATKDEKQGDFYSTTIGPYDFWAIEYGYKVFSGNESKELQKIASRSGEKGLAFSTDEDTRSIDPDPHSNRWDFSDNNLEFAKHQAKLVAETWPDIIDRLTEDGAGYQQPRRAFGVLLRIHGRAMMFAARYVGGLYVSRSHKGDKDAKAPFTVVSAKKQREALELLGKEVFGDEPFQFPAELYNHLAASHWNHWGEKFLDRSDFPAHNAILMWQQRILNKLFSSLTLQRVSDNELKIPADEDAFTTVELFSSVTKMIFAEVETIKKGDYTPRKPAISSIRRNLQRIYLQKLTDIAMGNNGGPKDSETLAYAELKDLQARIKKLLKQDLKLDRYSQAHLSETADRIGKVVEARMLRFP